MRLILTAGALALALALTACDSASHPGPARTASAAAVSPTSAAAAVSPTSAAAVVSPTSAASVSPTSQASRVSAVESVPSPEPIADWCHGTGYQRWQAVTKDLTALQADSAASATQLAVYGRQLASNAAAAAPYPPPGVSATAYKKGMEELTVSGRDDERDEVALATTITAEADAYLDNISSYASVKCP